MPDSFNRTPIAVCGSSGFLDYCDTIDGCIERIPLADASWRAHAFFLHITQLAFVTVDGDYLTRELADYSAALNGSQDYVLIIDYAHEGWALEERFAPHVLALHKMIGRYGFDPLKTCIIHHNNLLIDNPSLYKDFCAYNGYEPFDMIYSQSWLLNQAKFISEKFAGQDAFDRMAASYFQNPDHGIVKTHKYLCYNYFPRFPRVMFLMKLLERGLLSDGLVSFAGFRIADMEYDFYADAQAKLVYWPEGASYSKTLSALADMSPLVVDAHPGSTKNILAYQFDAGPYQKSLFSIVTDAGFDNGLHMKRITEKFLKPVLHMHPFILFGEPGGLAVVRDLGFQTFGNFIDESYDAILPADRRMDKIVDAVDELCAFDIKSIQAMRSRVSDAVFHNFYHLAYGFYGRVRHTSERSVIEYIQKALDSGEPIVFEVPLVNSEPSDTAVRSYEKIDFDSPLVINASFAWDDIIVLDGREASRLQDNRTHGNHCVLLRGASGQGEKLRIRLEVKSRGAKSLMVHIKSPLHTEYQFIYNLDLGIISSSDVYETDSDIECSAKHLDNGWVGLEFDGQIGRSEGPLHMAIYLGREGFEYASETPTGVLIAKFSVSALRVQRTESSS
ncbi:hypothetical protein [Methylobacterium sp. Leaf94]|uniref:hypothetical protein n=1 Tax=Methylobacterium sp. Leaf94 TaxID=1736250 RepID=UPI0012E3A5AD|nr:hypothetical protein [Methylobacterium sp. Leaf94]